MESRSRKPVVGLPPLSNIRIASFDDIPGIVDLLTESMKINFRLAKPERIPDLIENGVLTIVQLNSEKKICGCLSLKDYPIAVAINSKDWEDFIWTKFKLLDMNSRNSLFIHLLAWNPAYGREGVDRMLRAVFMHDPYVHYLAMIRWHSEYPFLIPSQFRSEASFKRVQCNERGVKAEALPILCVAERREVSPRMRIRRAVEEDNDDLVPILNRHSARLKEMYGEFYISELISRHPESERALLVCEHNELAFGVMCLNTQINLESLEENYELSPFSGLRKIASKPVKPVISEDSSYNLIRDSSHLPVDKFKDVIRDSRSIAPKIGWMADNDDVSEILSQKNSNIEQLELTDYMMILDEDEDDLEYDIINIDTELMRVPKMMSYDAIDTEATCPFYSISSDQQSILDENFVKVKKKIQPSNQSHLKSLSTIGSEPPHYTGPINAFLIELFAVSPEYDERYGFDILEVAFELFPDRDYCIICLPSNQCTFPLLEHFTLVTPFAVKKTFINESLYVAHVNSVRGLLRVRYGEAMDLPNVNVLLENAPRRMALVDLFYNSIRSHTLESYIMLSENLPIGVAVVGPLEESVSTRAKYELSPETTRGGDDGTVLMGILSPAFEPHARWFMRDILRHSKYTMLFWMCRLGKSDMNANRNLMSFTSRMVPVRPRRALPNLTGSKELDFMFKDDTIPYALWFIERPMTSLPKVDVNDSIVIVGASSTGLAFLESLVSGPTAPYLTFTNITIVSDHGIPTVHECLRAADTCIPKDGRFTDRYLKSIGLHFFVDVITGVMAKIDRKQKCIYLKSGGIKNYDTLVLTFGQQYQHPDYLKESLERAKEVEKGVTCVRLLMDNPKYQPDRVPPPPEIPENVMIINSINEANNQLKKLMVLIADKNELFQRISCQNRVVVYGDCIEAYCCIAALLELGLSSDMIALVEPFAVQDSGEFRVNCFNNEYIDERIQNSIEKLQVHVYRRTVLAGWRLHNGRITMLRLLSRRHAFQIPVFAFFYYGRKAIDIHAFKAVNECGLVYDGGLVIGPNFDTNDPSIYAAGTCTKYSRALYGDKWTHKYFNSESIGEELAQIFLKKLDPFKIANPNVHDRNVDILAQTYDFLQGDSSLTRVPKNMRKWEPVTRYQSPVYIYATLPGPLYYMKMKKPGVEIPMEVEASLPRQLKLTTGLIQQVGWYIILHTHTNIINVKGHALITTHKGSYFRLHLNVLHTIQGITCLSLKPFNLELFVQTYGKHESFFNKLLTRYVMKQIDDFFSYFTQSWMATVYQETFDLLMYDINEQSVGTIYDIAAASRSTISIESEKLACDTALRSLHSYYPSTTDIRPSAFSGTDMPQDAEDLGCFRAILEKFVLVIESKVDFNEIRYNTEDIPTECGQRQHLREEVRAFWNVVKGDKMVMKNLGRYLHQYKLINPHYALPVQEKIC